MIYHRESDMKRDAVKSVGLPDARLAAHGPLPSPADTVPQRPNPRKITAQA